MKSLTTHGPTVWQARDDRNGRARLPGHRLFRALRNHFRNERQYRELERLPDYLLKDVGLTRADISAASRRLL
jgi:uncharacterized protein YjiS (DUF1127 family)